MVVNTKPNTNRTALATQVEGQVEKKTHTTQTHRNRHTDKEWAVEENEAIIGKAPGLRIHTHVRQTPSRVSAQTLRGIFREYNFIKFADMPCGGCECVAKGGCMQGCCVGGRIGGRSRQWMERVTVSTKSTRVGHTVRQCRCRRREPIIEGGSPPLMVVACETGH